MLNLLKCVKIFNSTLISPIKAPSNRVSLSKLIYSSHFLQNVHFVSTKKDSVQSDSTEVPLDVDNKDEEFITIYANPGIRYLAIINKALWFPTLGCGALYPISVVLLAAGFITTRTLTTTLFVATWTCLVFHVLGANVWRKIGFLYVNKDMTKLKVSYVSYWGPRNDVILPIGEIMSFSDLPKSPTDFMYYKVKTFDSKFLEFYKLEVRTGEIVKPEIFEKIFGYVK